MQARVVDRAIIVEPKARAPNRVVQVLFSKGGKSGVKNSTVFVTIKYGTVARVPIQDLVTVLRVLLPEVYSNISPGPMGTGERLGGVLKPRRKENWGR